MRTPNSPLINALLGQVGSRWRINQLTYLDKDIGFVYMAAPAAANIRTIGSLQKGVAHVRGEDFEIRNLGKINNRDDTQIATPKKLGFTVFDQMLRDDSVIKLAFVRDPIARFASVYRNYFSMNAQKSLQRVKLFEFLGMSIEENLTMLDLAELLNEEEGLSDFSPQLTLQRKLIAYDVIDYHFIGEHEQWDEDYARISMEIFGCETPKFDPVKDLNIDPEGDKLLSLVDDETRAALEVAYADDYDMLDEISETFPDGFAAE